MPSVLAFTRNRIEWRTPGSPEPVLRTKTAKRGEFRPG